MERLPPAVFNLESCKGVILRVRSISNGCRSSPGARQCLGGVQDQRPGRQPDRSAQVRSDGTGEWEEKGARCLLPRGRTSALLLLQPPPTTSSPHARPPPQVTSLALMPNACYIIAGWGYPNFASRPSHQTNEYVPRTVSPWRPGVTSLDLARRHTESVPTAR